MPNINRYALTLSDSPGLMSLYNRHRCFLQRCLTCTSRAHYSQPIPKAIQPLNHSKASSQWSNQPPASSGVRSSLLPKDSSAQSLLAELFPQETERSNARAQSTRKIKKIPLSPLNVVDEDQDGYNATARHSVELAEESVHRGCHVVALKKAGKNLADEDFRRLVPGDMHLEGWSSAEVLHKVIRGRDMVTLEPNGSYYLLFPTFSTAQTYVDYVKKNHNIALIYSPTPNNSTPPILPPMPMYSRLIRSPREPSNDGNSDQEGVKKDFGGERQPPQAAPLDFTLVPASQRLDISIEKRPFPPLLQQLVAQEGYDILAQGRASDHEVMLSVEGIQPTLHAIRYAVNEDGRQRNMRWNLTGALKGVREIVLTPSLTEGDDPAGSTGAGEHSRSRRKNSAKRWIVSCKSRNEAKRFVGSWHRRDIGSMLPETSWIRREVIVNAEIIHNDGE